MRASIPFHKLVPICVLALAFILVAVFWTTARADFSTPFVENTKVGDVSKRHGYVVATSNKKESKGFLVIVSTDTEEYVVIPATAEKGTVDNSLLGRPVVIEAEIVKRIESPKSKRVFVTLKIRSVERAEISQSPAQAVSYRIA